MTGCLLWPPKRKVSFQQISKSGPVSDHTEKRNEILKLGAAGKEPGDGARSFWWVKEEMWVSVEVQVLREGPPKREWRPGSLRGEWGKRNNPREAWKSPPRRQASQSRHGNHNVFTAFTLEERPGLSQPC